MGAGRAPRQGQTPQRAPADEAAREVVGWPRPDLGDELWTVAHVATYLHCARSTAYTRVAEPGFPAALAIGQSRRRLWPAAEVRIWTGRQRRVPGHGPSRAGTPAERPTDRPGDRPTDRGVG